MAYSIDGKTTGGASIAADSGSVTSGTLTTSNANDIIIAASFVNTRLLNVSTAPSVSSVTDTSGLGLTWHSRALVTEPLDNSATHMNAMAVYWAYAPSVFSGTVTFNWTYNAELQQAVTSVYGVTGFTGTGYETNPWDANGPWTSADTVTAGTQPTVSGISTASGSGLLLAVAGSDDSTGPEDANSPGTWTAINNVNWDLESANAWLFTDEQAYATAQSSITVTWTNTAATGWCAYVDALTSPGGAPPFLTIQANITVDLV